MARKVSLRRSLSDAKVDVGHPLLKGALRIFDAFSPRDLVSGNLWLPAGSQINRPYARSVGRLSSSTVYSRLKTPLPSGPWTMAVIITPTAALSNSSAAGIVGFSDGATPGATTDRTLLHNGGVWSGYVYTTAPTYPSSAVAGAQGRTDSIVVTADGTNSNIYVNGVAGTSVSSGGSYGFTGYSDAHFYVGAAGAAYANQDVGISFCALINRAWTAREALDWSRRPWQVYRRARPSGIVYSLGGGAYDLDAQAAAFTLTAAAATTQAARVMDAQPGAFTLTAAGAILQAARVADAQPAAFTLTGQANANVIARAINASLAVYTLSQFDADLAYSGGGRVLDAQPAGFVVSTANAATLAARAADAQPAAFALSSLAASLLRAINVTASPAGYGLTPVDIGASFSRVVIASAASYLAIAQSASLIYSGNNVGATDDRRTRDRRLRLSR